jgi:curli biogenesis system outer membrane secretion channel CsgG
MFRKKNILIIILTAILVLVTCISVYSQDRPKIAVVAITSIASNCSWQSDSPLSIATTDLMVNALVNSNRFRVFERAKLDAICKEHGFQNFSGLVDQSTAVQLGKKMIGVRAIVTGTITNVNFSADSVFQIGPLKVRKSSVEVGMAIRFIDVTTGEILYSTYEESKTSASAVSANLPDLIPGGFGISMKSTASLLRAVEEICDCVVTAFVQKMDEKIARTEAAPLEGYVVQVNATSSGNLIQVSINLGKNSTIKKGDKIRIYQEGEVIRDPKTNEVLDRELILVAIGTVRMVKDKLSEVLITEKFTSREIRKEDIVQVMR